jgi:cytosine/adenosine deaminase-related metal-dependent hydrolase
MLLLNSHIVGQPGLHHILISDGKIHSIFNEAEKIPTGEIQFDCESAVAFPGLINSHDHLEFNLFPGLGNRVYKNYIEWGEDIHANNKEIISQVLNIPLNLRIQWGIYKNLVNGITTVVQHGRKLDVRTDLINVYQKDYSLHSPALEKNWVWKLNVRASKKFPVTIHVGEGTDQERYKEINSVIRWNLFRKKLVAVHGIAMRPEQAENFEAVIWCPVSNFFLFEKTAAIDELKTKTEILFGTDSTLTGGWNIWEHLSVARKTNFLTDKELILALTKTASKIWGLNTGELTPGKDADIVIANKTSGDTNNLFDLNPRDILLVICKGELVLFDQAIRGKIKGAENFCRTRLQGSVKYVKGNLAQLIEKINSFNIQGINFYD